MKKLSVILSFKNEEKNIPIIIERLEKVFRNLNTWKNEIIFVNDNSTDKSEEVIKSFQKNHNIILVNLARNFGVSASVLAGFEISKGDITIYMDTDLQDPPEIIPELIKKFEEGYDVVHTRRVKRLGEPVHKLFLTKIAYKIINYFSDIDLPIECGDFKLISRRALNEIINMKEKDPYLRGLSIWVGFNQAFYDYVRQPRETGESKFTFLTKNPYLELIRAITSFSSKPLYLGIVLGLFTVIFSIVLILYSLFIKFSGLASSGVPSILIAISFFSGVVLIKLGIISLYLGRVYEQIKNRPQYIIKDIIKSSKD